MIIRAGGIVIDLQLKRLNQFHGIEAYCVDEKPMFYLKTLSEKPSFTTKKLEIKTQFYEVYDIDNGKLQLQYMEGQLVGMIIYRDRSIELYPVVDTFEIEYLLSQYAFVYWIRKYTNGLYIHCSSICYENSGILFCAKSGTGKSTQRRLWEKYGDAICINDDKNVLSVQDGKIVILPNPWSGKHFKNTNMTTRVRGIVFLAQAKDNTVVDVPKTQAFSLILNQIQLPSKSNEEQWNKSIDVLLSLPTVKLNCNMEKEAFETLERELRKRGVFDEIKG